MNFEFANYCPQLFYLAKGGMRPPEPLASSILVNIGGYFLITANHVFENKRLDEVILFVGSEKIVTLCGDTAFYKPIGSRDNIDLFIVKLDDPLVNIIKTRYQFLHHKNIDLSESSVFSKPYVFFGFIANKTKLKRKTFESSPFSMCTVSKEIPLDDKPGFSNKETLYLSYNRRKQSYLDRSSRNIGPGDLQGLSGGGVWEIIKENRPELKLAGIMIEERLNKGYIIATKAYLIVDLLHQRFRISRNMYNSDG